VAPVNETDLVLLPEGLKALKKVAKEVGVDLRGAYLNLAPPSVSRATPLASPLAVLPYGACPAPE
jgi:hypothetical protein